MRGTSTLWDVIKCQMLTSATAPMTFKLEHKSSTSDLSFVSLQDA